MYNDGTFLSELFFGFGPATQFVWFLVMFSLVQWLATIVARYVSDRHALIIILGKIFGYTVLMITIIAALPNVIADLRLIARCDPEPSQLEYGFPWALAVVKRVGRFILFRETMHRNLLQRLLMCYPEPTYELRSPAALLGCLAAIPFVIILKRLSRKNKKRFVDQLAVSPEGLIPGSVLLEGGRPPKGQVKVAMLRNEKLCIVGSGLRMENWLVTPTHNTHSGCELWLLGDNGGEIKVDTSTEVQVCPDVVAYRVSEPHWATLRTAAIKMAPVRKHSTVAVTSSCDNKYSVAALSPTAPMGRVVYAGSTMPGFSGAAYANGMQVLGMHCHGGHVNGGYEILYIYAKLKIAIDEIPESSEDFFMTELTRGFDYEEGYNQAVLRVSDGTYHRTSKEVMQRLKQIETSDNWADIMEADELREELGSYEPECGELIAAFQGEDQRPVQSAQALCKPAFQRSPQASQLLAGNTQPQPANLSPSYKAKAKRLTRQLNLLKKGIELGLARRPAPTSPPTPPLTRSGVASAPNLPKPRKSAPGQSSQQTQNAKQF